MGRDNRLLTWAPRALGVLAVLMFSRLAADNRRKDHTREAKGPECATAQRVCTPARLRSTAVKKNLMLLVVLRHVAAGAPSGGHMTTAERA